MAVTTRCHTFPTIAFVTVRARDARVRHPAATKAVSD